MPLGHRGSAGGLLCHLSFCSPAGRRSHGGEGGGGPGGGSPEVFFLESNLLLSSPGSQSPCVTAKERKQMEGENLFVSLVKYSEV